MAVGKQFHGNLTPAHTCGCAAQCFEGVQRGSIIIQLKVLAPCAATHILRFYHVGSAFLLKGLLAIVVRLLASAFCIHPQYAAQRAFSRYSIEAVNQPEKALATVGAFYKRPVAGAWKGVKHAPVRAD